jgi:hypothetical protein
MITSGGEVIENESDFVKERKKRRLNQSIKAPDHYFQNQTDSSLRLMTPNCSPRIILTKNRC